MIAVPGVALDLDAVGRRAEDSLHEESGTVQGVPDDDELTGPRRARREQEQPVTVAERGLHAPARDGDAEGYFLVAEKISLISFTAATSSAAAFASTLCLFLLQSFAAFQKVSCRSGYFVRCSGLK